MNLGCDDTGVDEATKCNTHKKAGETNSARADGIRINLGAIALDLLQILAAAWEDCGHTLYQTSAASPKTYHSKSANTDHLGS